VLLGCGSPSVAGDDVKDTNKVQKSDAEWRSSLSAEQYRILRQKGTERAFSGKYWDSKAEGVYTCGGCGQALFSSDHKFKSGTGWPSFYQAISASALDNEADNALWMSRTEILCSRCGGHLGHVFPDGPPPTGKRFCVNGNALNFQAKEKDR
jgi:peptide-methionine (R)-S-oxide reductase